MMKIVSQAVTALVLIVSSFNVFASQVTVSEGYIREVIPGNQITSSYMTITNASEQALKLIGAVSKDIPRIEIHEHLMADGMMKMRQKAFIEIPAGESVVLQPMGLHLMMFELNQPLKAGQEVAITLQFENAVNVDVALPVRSIKQAKTHHHH